MNREAVVKEALEWISTPFHDCSGVKGVGTDCLHFIKGVFVNVGLIEDFIVPTYSPQWFQHRDEPLFLEGISKYAHRIEVAGPGDISMYNYGRHAAHAAIVIDDTTMVHAYRPLECVMRDSRAGYTHLLHSHWSVF